MSTEPQPWDSPLAAQYPQIGAEPGPGAPNLAGGHSGEGVPILSPEKGARVAGHMTATPAHFLTLHADYEGEIAPRLVCTAPPDARCRRRHADPLAETWTSLDETTAGHECWAVEWIDEAGFADAVRWSGPDGVIVRVPVAVAYDEGVVIQAAALPDTADALPMTAPDPRESQAMAEAIRSVTDLWDEPLDEVQDVPQVVDALIAAGWHRCGREALGGVRRTVADPRVLTPADLPRACDLCRRLDGHEPTCPTRLIDTPLGRALSAGIPWWLAHEAVASTSLDEGQTHSVEEESHAD